MHYQDPYKNNFPHYMGWRAEWLDHYFYVDIDMDGFFRVYMVRDWGIPSDNKRYERGNYFRHKEDAEHYSLRMKLLCGSF